jgi:hypothetical protein
VPSSTPLRLYGEISDKAPLDWAWVDGQLRSAGTYWVAAATPTPHPRPVWGVWSGERLFLSIGSPPIVRALAIDPAVSVHLDSGTDAVIVEGSAAGATADPAVIAAYDAKYDWTYDVATYGPLLRVHPRVVLAWRTAGWAGRESFQRTGRWIFPA